MKSIILAGVLATVSISANAGEFYVLADVGQSKLEVSFEDANFSKSDTMFDLGIGYNLNQNFAFEFAYRDLGGISESDGYASSSSDLTSLQLSALGKVPVNDAMYLYGRLGLARLTADYSLDVYNSSQYDESGSETKTKALIGLGMGYNITPAASLRVEYIRHAEWDDVTFSSLSVGATYSF
ncbi:MAG TPA: outer membrane beta-barrel protein [Cellvibrionaceae bacterium]